MSKTRRLLLLELVGRERWVHNSRFFPFIKGGAEQLGLDTRWLCFGAQTKSEKIGSAAIAEHYDLGELDLSELTEEIEKFKPTHIVISDPISQEALDLITLHALDVDILSLSRSSPRFLDGEQRIRRLHQAASGESLVPTGQGAMSPSSPRPFDTAWIQSRTDWLLAWLGESPKGPSAVEGSTFLVDVCLPSYDAVMVNEEARGFEPFIIIMGGVSCDHFARVSDNVFYEGLVLSDCPQQYGCGYCTHYRGAVSDLSIDPVEVAERQLSRVLETAGELGRSSWQFEVYDIRLFRMLDRFVDRVLELGLPPSTFWFEPRVDRFLEVAPTLESLLPCIVEREHRLGLLRMGAENLVDEENARFNKGITLAQIDRARTRLAELARDHEGTFVYDPTFGYITCSPWTRLEAFEEGVDKAIERGFAADDIWLYTPLLLYHGSPITAAAEREGDVLIEAFDDVAMLYEAAINHVDFSTVKPWRFIDERVGVAFGLIVRFYAATMRKVHKDTIFEGDELYEWLLVELARRGGFIEGPDRFAREVIALVKANALNQSPKELLIAALDRSTRRLKLHDVAEAVTSRFGRRLGGVTIADLRYEDGDIVMNVKDKDIVFKIRLCLPDTNDEEIARSEHWSVVIDTPLDAGVKPTWLEGLVAALDLAITRFDPALFENQP